MRIPPLLACLALLLPACRPDVPDYPTRRVDNPYHVGDGRLTGVEPAEGQNPKMLQETVLRRASVRRVEPVASSRWRLTTASPGERFVAYVIHEPRPRLFVHDQQDNVTWSVSGLPHGDKPLIGLKWESDATLSFQRWADPRSGMAYLLDADAGELVAARVISQGAGG